MYTHPNATSKAKRRSHAAAAAAAAAHSCPELFDTNKDGAVDYHELKVAMLVLGVRP